MQVGVRDVKNRFSALADQVNQTGQALMVTKNNRPWVLIQPADEELRRRHERREKLRQLTASIDNETNGPAWDPNVSDRDLLGEERMRRFG